jgi:ribosomal protein L37AE/L43A
MSAFKEKSFKTLKCNDCGEPVEKVDNKATGVICYKCVLKMTGGHITNLEEANDKTNEHSGTSNEEFQKK